MDDADDDGLDGPGPIFPSQMTVTVMSPSRGISASSSTARVAPPSRVRVLFDALVNTSSSRGSSDTTAQPVSKGKPRLVYIRDFPTLAPTSSAWYPPLLSAVRARRQGPISKPHSPIPNPMTIIFGMTPSLAPPSMQSNSSGPTMSALMNQLTSLRAPSASKQGESDWGEDEAANKTRERRLRRRLKRWENGDPLKEELPKLFTSSEGEGRNSPRPELIIIGGSSSLAAAGPGILDAGSRGDSSNRSAGSDIDSFFFRTSTLVPTVRSLVQEQSCRISRRREINELTLRMGVGAVGGVIEETSAANAFQDPLPGGESSVLNPDPKAIWVDLGNKIQVWSNVRQIADRAVGSVAAIDRLVGKSENGTLEPSTVTWSDIQRAWVSHTSTRDIRKTWMKETIPRSRELEEDEDDEKEDNDQLLEKLKNDPALEMHERRLLPCIVDSGETFCSPFFLF